jgi:apolipoprotein N-acyltransferase
MERLADRVILLWGWRQALLALLAGALLALGQAPFDFFAVGFVSFTLLVWLLDGVGAPPGRGWFEAGIPAFAVGWWFGFGYFLAGLFWVGNALLVEAEDFAWALPLAVLALPAGLAIFYGLATLAARLVWSDDLGRIAALALAFGVAEWLRATVLTGFPWNAVGYVAMPIPLLMQSVALTGLFGMSALAVFVFATPALLANRRHLRGGVVLALLLVLAHAGYGSWRLTQVSVDDAQTLSVRIVQPSIDQSEKWDGAARDRIFSRFLELSALPPAEGAAPPQLIVWPETSFPFLLTDRPDALVALSGLLQEGQLLAAGAVRVEGSVSDGGVRYYNSILMINDQGEIVDGYDKVHLVPFGEYIPFEEVLARFGLRQLVQAFPGFTAGSQRRTLDAGEGVRLLPFICYEIIFPAENGLASESNLIVNVTNDAWFGDTPGPFQHFRQSQIRSVMLGLPMVRAANNGISGMVDPYGRIVDAFQLEAVGVLDVDISLARASPPPLGATQWGQVSVFVGLVLLIVGAAATSRRRAN